jgi:hypothetical protein
VTLGDILNNVDKGFEKFNEHCYLAAETIQNTFIERIFDNGLDSNNDDIANYSDRPSYISGARNKSFDGFYQGGYAEFKRKINKTKASQRGVYDVTLTGETRFEFSKQLERVSDLEYQLVVLGEAAAKAQKVESLSGKKIFVLTEQEEEEWISLIVEGLDELINGR